MTSFLKPDPCLQRGFKDKSRLGMVASYSCWACEIDDVRQISRTEVHHEAGIGAGMKASDLLTLGICNEHHNDFGGKAGVTIHINISDWEDKYGKQLDIIGELNERIFRDFNLKGKDLKHYNLIKEYCGKEKKK
jgi:hypothetical protein